VRIWDIHPSRLCRHHLLGEHAELHALWSVIVGNKSGFAHHPETMRWRGRLKALYLRHDLLVREMERRGYRHGSPLPASEATGSDVQDEYLATPEEQLRMLRSRDCDCDV